MNIKKNYLYNLVYQILLIILPLITMPYISRVLGVENVGIFSYTRSIVSYFMLFALLGINNYGNRSIAKVREDKEKLSTTFVNIYTMQLVSAIIFLILYLIFIFINNSDYKIVYIAQILYMASSIFDINWFYFGIEKFKVTVSRNIIVKVIITILIFVFVRTKDDIFIYSLLLSFGTFVSQILLWFFLRNYIYFRKPNYKSVIHHIKPNLILFVSVIAVSVYRIMDKVMIGYFSNITQVGLYENADKITLIPMALVTSLGTVMLPRMSNLIAKEEFVKGEKYIRDSLQLSVFFAVAIMFGMASVSERFVILYLGEEFFDCGILIRYLAPVILIATCANIIRTQYIIPMGKDRTYVISVVCGAIVNLIINIIMIKRLGAFGAVIGTVIAEFVVLFVQVMLTRNELDFLLYIKDNYLSFISGLVMFITIQRLDMYVQKDLMGLFILILIGVVVYFFSSFFLYFNFKKNRFCEVVEIVGISKVKKRRKL